MDGNFENMNQENQMPENTGTQDNQMQQMPEEGHAPVPDTQNAGSGEVQQPEKKAKRNKDKPVSSQGTLASSKATALVKTKYNLPQIDLGLKKELYVVYSNSPTFDRVLRRTPREVFSKSDIYIVPLGFSCTETVVSAYGLSNGFIYKNQTWIERLGAFQENRCEQTANGVIHFLRAAAVLKYLYLSGAKIDSNNQFEFSSDILNVTDSAIISAFAEMVR